MTIVRNANFLFKRRTVLAAVAGAIFATSAGAETFKLRIGAGHPVQGIA
ncbi:MAG: hypothetical protein RL509_2169, partial [Pseudomonadota bacterium]